MREKRCAGTGIEDTIQRAGHMAGEKVRDLLLQHAERPVRIDGTVIALRAEHRFDHREDEDRIDGEIELAAPALRRQARRPRPGREYR